MTDQPVKLRTKVLQDERLSLVARGIYCYLMALPPSATPTPREIAQQGPESIDAIRKALAELEACGYIEPVGIAAPRISIPLGLRYKTLRRDGYACRYCGARAPEAALVVDHVVPVTLNGKTVLENLITACDPCNTGKSGQAPEPWLVKEVEGTTREWLASAAAEAGPEDVQMTRPKGRGHVTVRVRR